MIRVEGGRAQTKIASQSKPGPYTSASGKARYLPVSKYGSYWISWRGSRVALGLGTVVGQETIWNTTVTNYTYSINYIGMASLLSNDTHWLYYDGK